MLNYKVIRKPRFPGRILISYLTYNIIRVLYADALARKCLRRVHDVGSNSLSPFSSNREVSYKSVPLVHGRREGSHVAMPDSYSKNVD